MGDNVNTMMRQFSIPSEEIAEILTTKNIPRYLTHLIFRMEDNPKLKDVCVPTFLHSYGVTRDYVTLHAVLDYVLTDLKRSALKLTDLAPYRSTGIPVRIANKCTLKPNQGSSKTSKMKPNKTHQNLTLIANSDGMIIIVVVIAFLVALLSSWFSVWAR